MRLLCNSQQSRARARQLKRRAEKRKGRRTTDLLSNDKKNDVARMQRRESDRIRSGLVFPKVGFQRVGGDIESFCGEFKDQGAPKGRVGWRSARSATIPWETIVEFRVVGDAVAKMRRGYRQGVIVCDLR